MERVICDFSPTVVTSETQQIIKIETQTFKNETVRQLSGKKDQFNHSIIPVCIGDTLSVVTIVTIKGVEAASDQIAIVNNSVLVVSEALMGEYTFSLKMLFTKTLQFNSVNYHLVAKNKCVQTELDTVETSYSFDAQKNQDNNGTSVILVKTE